MDTNTEYLQAIHTRTVSLRFAFARAFELFVFFFAAGCSGGLAGLD